MTTPPDSESAFPLAPTNQITQDIDETQGQVIAQMMGGLAIGKLTVYLSHAQTEAELPQPDTTHLGDNPYRGLLAFREIDGDRFFGREMQIEQLWEKFCHLHEDQSTVRVLPIYGPSGSGKSSLARAGLIPALGKKSLPGRDRARLAVLVPGTHPLEALATVLARIATNDSIPVEKSQEFERVLTTKSKEGKYEGLRRIADVLPEIDFSPLIILVDQFEEVYTYALALEQTERDAFIAERDAFIENLLCAAAEPTKRVSVILTLRSDFLGDTQQHPRLNKLFSTQGFLVPIMQPEELEIAITKPAEQAGYKLDKAIVTLLVEQTQGREGALPLLQFALTRIWEGLQNGIDPAETLEKIGGVGGALAGEAQRLYESLSEQDQAIARSIFLALVQVSEDSGDTRRRAAVSELIATDGDEARVWSIINRFAEPRVRFLVIFSDKQYGEMIEMIEVAHEALIRNWKQLRDWLKECREALRKKRKIEDAAEEWKYHKKSKDYLLQGRSLRDAREFMQAANKETSLSSLATEFVTSSQQHFALTKIWEELRNGVKPSDTLELEQFGGVGGALANEAKRVYDALSPEQQKIAHSIFLALIQLNDDYQNTRRRATFSNLITSEQDETLVREVIDRFVHPGVWILVSNEEQVEMAEVVHEALICNWAYLQHWLKEQWEALRKKGKIEKAADEWNYYQKSKDYLLQGRSLRDAREFIQGANKEMALSSLAIEFVEAGVQKQRSNIFKLASVSLVFPLIGTLITAHLQIISRANLILYRDDCKPNSEIKGLLEYMWWTKNANRLRDLKLCRENLRGIKLPEVVITTSDFKNANLSNIDFHKATILNSNFRGATIAYTNFSDAWLAESDFQCSDTECTLLLGANFQNAKLQKAKLQNSVLVNANFRGADLTNANLDGAEGLTTEQLETAILCHTIIPKYITISGTRDCPDELP